MAERDKHGEGLFIQFHNTKTEAINLNDIRIREPVVEEPCQRERHIPSSRRDDKLERYDELLGGDVDPYKASREERTSAWRRTSGQPYWEEPGLGFVERLDGGRSNAVAFPVNQRKQWQGRIDVGDVLDRYHC